MPIIGMAQQVLVGDVDKGDVRAEAQLRQGGEHLVKVHHHVRLLLLDASVNHFNALAVLPELTRVAVIEGCAELVESLAILLIDQRRGLVGTHRRFDLGAKEGRHLAPVTLTDQHLHDLVAVAPQHIGE